MFIVLTTQTSQAVDLLTDLLVVLLAAIQAIGCFKLAMQLYLFALEGLIPHPQLLQSLGQFQYIILELLNIFAAR